MGAEQPYQENEKDLSPDVCRNLDISGTSEERNPPRQNLMARLLDI